MKFPADRALKPAYVTLSPNSSILLAEGRLKLSKDKITCEGSGLVRIKWRPSPNINFKMKCDISPIVHKELPMGPAKLEVIEENSLNFDVFVTRINNERKDGLIDTKIFGEIIYPKTIPKEPRECNEIKFHLTNFISYAGSVIFDSSLRTGRLTLESDNLLINIDKNSNINKLYEILEKSGGYAITHTGLLKRKNSTLKLEEASDQLEALYYFFAFLSGRWCGPILSVGLLDGAEVWKTWDVITEEWYAVLDELDGKGRQVKRPVSSAGDRLRLTSGASGWSWTIGVEAYELNQAFLGFMKKWEDQSMRDALKTAISLYVEANQAFGGTENAIVLAQSGLELLASLHADDHLKGKPCKNRFNDISADERLRWLLEDLAIPIEIPSNTKELQNYSDDKLINLEYKDGPKAITFLRNGIIHPNRKLTTRLRGTEDKIKLQALSLGVWYLEMALLRLFNYMGHYANRLWRFRENSFQGGSDFLQQVPWDITLRKSECDNCPIQQNTK